MQQAQQAFAVGMQKAKITRAAETLGQYVTQQEAQELHTGQGSGALLLGFAVLVTKSHQAVLASDDVFFLDHAFVEIAPEIDQSMSKPFINSLSTRPALSLVAVVKRV